MVVQLFYNMIRRKTIYLLVASALLLAIQAKAEVPYLAMQKYKSYTDSAANYFSAIPLSAHRHILELMDKNLYEEANRNAQKGVVAYTAAYRVLSDKAYGFGADDYVQYAMNQYTYAQDYKEYLSDLTNKQTNKSVYDEWIQQSIGILDTYASQNDTAAAYLAMLYKKGNKPIKEDIEKARRYIAYVKDINLLNEFNLYDEYDHEMLLRDMQARSIEEVVDEAWHLYLMKKYELALKVYRLAESRGAGYKYANILGLIMCEMPHGLDQAYEAFERAAKAGDPIAKYNCAYMQYVGWKSSRPGSRERIEHQNKEYGSSLYKESVRALQRMDISTIHPALFLAPMDKDKALWQRLRFPFENH